MRKSSYSTAGQLLEKCILHKTNILVAKQLYLEDNKTQSEIADIVGLSWSAVEKILELTQSVKTNTLVVKSKH